LDEPTTGLDPQARRALWEYLRGLHEKQEITVVLTTHYLEEAETLWNRVAIVDYGKLMALGTSTKLKVMGGDVIEAEVRVLPNQALEALKKFGSRA
jgi:ABC-2 type transport system ATP-binding protein